jgi:hypothetical protein
VACWTGHLNVQCRGAVARGLGRRARPVPGSACIRAGLHPGAGTDKGGDIYHAAAHSASDQKAAGQGEGEKEQATRMSVGSRNREVEDVITRKSKHGREICRTVAEPLPSLGRFGDSQNPGGEHVDEGRGYEAPAPLPTAKTGGREGQAKLIREQVSRSRNRSRNHSRNRSRNATEHRGRSPRRKEHCCAL